MKSLLSIFFTLIFYMSDLAACTAFQLRSQDGAIIYCRTMEFGMNMDANILVVPRDKDFFGQAPDDKPGLKWKGKYGFVGMNQTLGRCDVSDGMNEKGLIIGELYLPGFAQYEAFDPKKIERTIGIWEVPNFLLSTCATVEEVKKALHSVVVADQPMPNAGDFVLPVHFYIMDRTGAVAIAEYVKGKLAIYDQPLGVLTNSPPFEWHMINLENYINLSPVNVEELSLANWKVKFFGEGSGLLGLPGDFSPPSRFIRAALFSSWAEPQKTAADVVRMGFHILNTFNIFRGIVRSTSEESDFTQWVIVHDAVNLKTYFRSWESLSIQMVDLKKIDFSKKELQQISVKKEFVVEDVTKTIAPLTDRQNCSKQE